MSIYWRLLTQDEICQSGPRPVGAASANYLYNPERRPVTYVEAKYVEKVKGAVIRVQEGTAIRVGLSDVGR
jgi:hypothetical protein